MTSPRPHIKVMVEPETKQSPGLIFTKVHLKRQFCSLFFQEIVSLGFSPSSIRTMTLGTKKELWETTSHMASPSESQGKGSGHVNIPHENLLWILDPRNYPNSVDSSSVSLAVGSILAEPTSAQLSQSGSHPPVTGPPPRPHSSALAVRHQSMRGA